MTNYLLVYTDESGNRGVIESNANTKEELLDGIEDHILEFSWTVFSVNGQVGKETLVHDGSYDHVLPE